MPALLTSPNRELQWHQIRDELFKKYEKKYSEDSFTVILHRKLKTLTNVKKKSLGHQQVFYFIPSENQKEVQEEIDRETAHKRFDEIWLSFTEEQRKRELQYLLTNRFESIVILQNFGLQLIPIIREQMKSIKPRLRNSTEEVEKQFPKEERERLLEQLEKDLKYLDKFEQEIINDRTNQATVDKFKAQLQLLQEFTNKVVDTEYSGNFREAIQDLMRKAIEDVNPGGA